VDTDSIVMPLLNAPLADRAQAWGFELAAGGTRKQSEGTTNGG
jgi:hypothetical protein